MDGLAATPGRDRVRVLRDRRGHDPPRATVLVARARAAPLACSASCRSTSAAAARALVFMGDSGRRCSASRSRALGLRRAGSVAETTVATLLLPMLVLAVPILDTTLVTIVRLLEGRPVYQGGRDHSSHRLVRFGLSETHAVAAARARSPPRSAPRASPTTCSTTAAHARRRARHLRRCSCSSRASSPTSSAGREPATRRRAAAGVRGALAPAGRGARRLRRSIIGAFVAAYLLAFGWPGTVNQRHVVELALPILIAARYLAFIPSGCTASIWRYAGSRDLLAIARRSSSRRRSRSATWR